MVNRLGVYMRRQSGEKNGHQNENWRMMPMCSVPSYTNWILPFQDSEGDFFLLDIPTTIAHHLAVICNLYLAI
jgi:hypothetical protein